MSAPDAVTVAFGTEVEMGAPPRSIPLGYVHGQPDNPLRRAHEKLAAVAERLGGFRHPDPTKNIPTVYKGKWTPEEETRWECAVGVQFGVVLTDKKPVSQYPLEQPGKGRENAPTLRAERQRTGRRVTPA